MAGAFSNSLSGWRGSEIAELAHMFGNQIIEGYADLAAAVLHSLTDSLDNTVAGSFVGGAKLFHAPLFLDAGRLAGIRTGDERSVTRFQRNPEMFDIFSTAPASAPASYLCTSARYSLITFSLKGQRGHSLN